MLENTTHGDKRNEEHFFTFLCNKISKIIISVFEGIDS